MFSMEMRHVVAARRTHMHTLIRMTPKPSVQIWNWHGLDRFERPSYVSPSGVAPTEGAKHCIVGKGEKLSFYLYYHTCIHPFHSGNKLSKLPKRCSWIEASLASALPSYA
jgi:hypothetical protein